jgi:hypothetical protein
MTGDTKENNLINPFKHGYADQSSSPYFTHTARVLTSNNRLYKHERDHEHADCVTPWFVHRLNFQCFPYLGLTLGCDGTIN